MFKDLYNDTFQRHDAETFFQNLHNKVAAKPYFEKYKDFKTTIFALSYLFNFASILFASYAVYYVTQWITGNSTAAILIAIVFLIFLEQIKRKSSNEVFKTYFFKGKQIAFGWLMLSLACLAVSLASSSYGSKTGVETQAPDPELLAADSTANAYRQQIAQLEAENKEMKTQKDHTGTIYYRLQSVLKSNKTTIATLSARVLELDKKLEGKNELISGTYQTKVKNTAWIMVYIVILMELLFEACMAYIWYYNYRSYIERFQPSQQEAPKNKIQNTSPQLPETSYQIPPFSSNENKTAPIGFRQSKQPVKQPNETSETKPVLRKSETAEILVKQLFHPETTKSETSETKPVLLPNETTNETVLIINQDARYLRQKCKQAWRRIGKQKDPTTPTRNFNIFKNQLIALGYQIKEENGDLIFEKG